MKSTIKLSLLIILFTTLMIPTFQGCKKYEDGPALSLRSRTARVVNTWSVESYTVNGVNYTSLLADYNETYTKSGTYSYQYGTITGGGTWAFQNKDKEIRLTGSGNQSSQTLFILKLENKTFWYYYMDGSDKYELHLIEK